MTKNLTNLTDKEKLELFKKTQIAQMRTSQDKLQTILTETGILPNPNNYAKIFFQDKVRNKEVICPFCLNVQKLENFIYQHGLYKCRYCKNAMYEKTLSNMYDIFNQEKIDVQSYALWVYNYRLNGFFQKIDFQKWRKKLYDLEISYDFWDYYKRFKGEKKREYEEDL